MPQYNAVKPALPTYSFSKAARFYSKPLYQPSPNAVPVMPFQDGKFKPDDVKSFFNGRGGLYKAKKDNVLKENGIPGPGQYRIKGIELKDLRRFWRRKGRKYLILEII